MLNCCVACVTATVAGGVCCGQGSLRDFMVAGNSNTRQPLAWVLFHLPRPLDNKHMQYLNSHSPKQELCILQRQTSMHDGLNTICNKKDTTGKILYSFCYDI